MTLTQHRFGMLVDQEIFFCDSHLDLISSKFVWGFTNLQKVHLELKSESNVDMAQNIQQNNSMLYL